MEKKITKRVAVPLDGEHFRETTIDLVQTYDDNTKKLKGTKETSRVEGKLLKVAKPGQKSDMQLMNEENFEVLALVIVPEASSKKAKAATPPPPPAPEPEPEPPPEPEEEEEDEPDPPQEQDGEEEVEEASPKDTDASAEEEDDDMASKKTKKVTKKKVTKKAAPKKAAPKKAAPKKAASDGNGEAKAAPSSGQSGPPLDLSSKPLNAKEEKVLGALSNGAGQLTLEELAGAAFKGKKKSQANSWVRNSMRRLVRGGLVKKVSRGTYEATAKGKKLAEA